MLRLCPRVLSPSLIHHLVRYIPGQLSISLRQGDKNSGTKSWYLSRWCRDLRRGQINIRARNLYISCRRWYFGLLIIFRWQSLYPNVQYVHTALGAVTWASCCNSVTILASLGCWLCYLAQLSLVCCPYQRMVVPLVYQKSGRISTVHITFSTFHVEMVCCMAYYC